GVAARLEPFVATRALLDLCGTFLAGLFVTLERLGNTTGLDTLQRACQYGGILKCLACTLGHERHHWMTSVAKERGMPAGPGNHRFTHIQRRFRDLGTSIQ